MGRRGKRRRIARSIYQDATGRAGIVRVGDQTRELRFPPETPIADIREDMADLAATLRGSGSTPAARGTLAAAVDAWAAQEQHLTSWRERRAELRAWVARLGHRRLTAITAADVRETIGIWTKADVSPKTIRNRLWSLKHLYQLTRGRKKTTPVDDVTPPAKVRTIITPVSPATILTVYKNLLAMEQDQRPAKRGQNKTILRDAKTRARFMVRASTGRRPSEIMRATPEDVDLEQRVWRVRDGKGGWSEGLYLNDDMKEAWRVFVEASAWGPFNTGSMAEVLRRAGWPKGRPYAMRASVGIELSELGNDLADVGAWLGHTDVQTTRSAYVPVLKSRMQRMSEQIDGRLNGWSLP